MLPDASDDDDPFHVPGQAEVISAGDGLREEGAVDNYVSPFSEPLPEPDPSFLAFYDQLGAVSFPEVWDLRLPAETYDHVVSGAEAPGLFLTSDQCIGCHNSTVSNSFIPNMMLEGRGPCGE